jgi:hypothetical protein
MKQQHFGAPAELNIATAWHRVVRRRSFLRALGSAGATLPAVALSTAQAKAAGQLTSGDVAILRFLAAAEIIESDLWTQYEEFGGVNGGNPAYVAALKNLDGDMPQYITDNTDDELSHADFLNAYLKSKGAQPVNLDKFRILPSSPATGARKIKRLTNLQSLNVDTSYYTRYRSKENPDLGTTNFPQAVTIMNRPAVPVSDTITPPNTSETPPFGSSAAITMQAIANTAAFHFAMIEQGGSSLYTTMSLKATSLEVLRIVVSIGGVEVDHFSLWHDKLGNAVSQPLAPLTDGNLTFPDLNSKAFNPEDFQTNKILPEPCDFLGQGFPECSVIRPSSTMNSGAVAAVKALTADRLFLGQSQEFLNTIMELAVAADAAQRQLED